MKIAVCVKYVPVVAHIGFDAAIKTMIREGVPSEINPFDRLGVVCAIALKADPADQVLALSMGPPQAQEGLVHCLALGADRAVLLTDRALAGSDTLATARAWRSCWPKNGRMELFAVATAQTPKRGRLDEIAELLGLPLPPWQRPKSPCWRSTTRQMETPAGGEAPRRRNVYRASGRAHGVGGGG